MDSIASQITSLMIVYSTFHSGADQSKHQSSASLAFVWEIHRWPVNFPHKWPVTRKIFPFDDVIMKWKISCCTFHIYHELAQSSCLKCSYICKIFNIMPYVDNVQSYVTWSKGDIKYARMMLNLEGDWNAYICEPVALTIFGAWFSHDDAIKWKHFPRYWPFVRGIHRSPVNSPHKGQWRGALMFSLIYARINGWVNKLEAGDLRRYHAHYDVIVMYIWWAPRSVFELQTRSWVHGSMVVFDINGDCASKSLTQV